MDGYLEALAPKHRMEIQFEGSSTVQSIVARLKAASQFRLVRCWILLKPLLEYLPNLSRFWTGGGIGVFKSRLYESLWFRVVSTPF
jgi:hypothetical protein